jgi:hypothetical protein
MREPKEFNIGVVVLKIMGYAVVGSNPDPATPNYPRLSRRMTPWRKLSG